MSFDSKSFPIMCVNPNWKDGVIVKRVALTVNGDIIPFTYNLEKLSHMQFIRNGEYLFSARQNLHTNKVTTDITSIHSGRSIACTSLPGRAYLQNLFDYISNPTKMLFSDFNDYVDLSYLGGPNVKVKDYKVYTGGLLFRLGLAGDVDMMEYIIMQLPHSRKEDLPMNWRNATPLPKVLNVRERLTTAVDGTTVTHQSEHWLLSHKDGRNTFPDLEPTKGAHISAVTSRTLKIYDSAPTPIPDDVVYAVKFIVGARIEEGEALGVSWTLYRKTGIKTVPPKLDSFKK